MKKSFSIFLAILLFTATSVMPSYNVMATTSSTITRSQIEQRAMSMVNLSWTFDVSKNQKISTGNLGNVTQPKQLKNQTVAKEIGIPYNWGGFDGIDTTSYNAPWTSFLNAISKGAYAGNVNSSAGLGYITGTAGLDCSGFVQASYGIDDYKLSTSTMFNKYFVKINLSDIKHMDILDHPGDHVVMFDKWGTLNGVYGAFTYEATTDTQLGGIQGTKQYFISLYIINNGGYIPGRYINVANDIIPDVPILKTQTYPTGSLVQIANVNTASNFRSAASTNSAIIGVIPKGTILGILAYNTGWYNFNYNGKSGWVSGDLLGLLPSGKYVTINGVYQLNIRSNSNETAYIVGVLNQNQYASVLGTSADGKWTNINLNGVKGWSSTKYLK